MCFKSFEDIIGVRVKDTMAEIMIETAKVIANSLKSLPTTSPMKMSGIRTAIKEIVNEMMVNPICLEPFKAASKALSPCSMYLEIFSIITMASSTTNPVAMVNAIRERLFKEKPAKYITANVPTNDKGTATPGMIVANKFPKNA